MAVSYEDTGPWGTDGVLENHPEYLARDACLIGEVNTQRRRGRCCSAGGKGILWLRLTLRGEAYDGGLCERENTINRTVHLPRPGRAEQYDVDVRTQQRWMTTCTSRSCRDSSMVSESTRNGMSSTTTSTTVWPLADQPCSASVGVLTRT